MEEQTPLKFVGSLTFAQQEKSGWQCELFGVKGGLILYPRKGEVPNAFWRWMQYVCFGNKWTKTQAPTTRPASAESIV